MLLQQTGVPDNLSYLLLGVAAFFVIIPSWIASMFWRARALRRQQAMLDQLQEDQPNAG